MRERWGGDSPLNPSQAGMCCDEHWGIGFVSEVWDIGCCLGRILIGRTYGCWRGVVSLQLQEGRRQQVRSSARAQLGGDYLAVETVTLGIFHLLPYLTMPIPEQQRRRRGEERQGKERRGGEGGREERGEEGGKSASFELDGNGRDRDQGITGVIERALNKNKNCK